MSPIISLESFIAGFAFGGTTVVVGQPLETLKTLSQMQQLQQSSGHSQVTLRQTASQLYQTGGLRAFYRGGTPLLLGGGLNRSAQFGLYNSVIQTLETRYGPTDPSKYYLGCINPHVVLAGWSGGIGRGLVECPFEMVKVRHQIVSTWKVTDVFQGFGATLFRNSFLFSSFVIYMDLLKQQLQHYQHHHQDSSGLVTFLSFPFVKAGICSSLAWFTIWPLDVVKTRRQSGQFEGKSFLWLLKDVVRAGDMYRGLSAGIARCFLANGVSMEVYTLVERELKTMLH